jgi:hypothetical protein
MEDRSAAVAELHRVLAAGGRVVVNTPGRIQPVFGAMEQAIVDNLDPSLGAFVTAVFSMHDPAELHGLLHDAGFHDVAAKEYVASLDLPGPAEFLWNYINLTPMGPQVAEAAEDSRAAMERQFVEAWSPHLVNGQTTIDQPIALASGRR